MKSDTTGSLKSILLRHGTHPSWEILDVGCGAGNWTFAMAGKAKSAVGIDPDAGRIASARQAFTRDNLSFRTGSGEKMAFSAGSFDAVVFCQSLHHVPAKVQKTALDEGWRVLKEGGRLLVVEPVYGKGLYDALERIYHDEGEARLKAEQAVSSSIGDRFDLDLERQVNVEDTCTGFEDFYRNEIRDKAYIDWDESHAIEVREVLDRCRRDANGAYILDYFVNVWGLARKP